MKRPYRIDLTGKKIGRLTVIKRDPIKRTHYTRSHVYWICKCECNNIVSVRACNLSGKPGSHCTKSCGCLQKEAASKTGKKERLPLGVKPARDLYCTYRNRANKMQKPFCLSQEEFLSLTKQNCHYCGQTPQSVRKNTKEHEDIYVYNGIDRVDSDGGYTTENVVPCCIICNRAKTDMPLTKFLTWAFQLVNHLNLNLDYVSRFNTTSPSRQSSSSC